MKVFVVGKLGEVVKKVYELEKLIEENPKNIILLAEYTAYQEILESWPIPEGTNIDIATFSFKLYLSQLVEREKELKEKMLDPFGPTHYFIVAEYLVALDKVREALTSLNDIGRYIGPSPWMELEDAKHP